MNTRVARLATLLLAALSPASALASFLPPEMLDKAADIVAIVVLIFVPIAVIVVFWIVHVLPEKVAEKRHHPQKEAITTVCLLSLLFGGMLWPIAWVWAYTRPVLHRSAYGTDLHEDYFIEAAERLREGKLSREEAVHALEELQSMEVRGALTPPMRTLKHDIERMLMMESSERTVPAAQPASVPPVAAAAAPAPSSQGRGGK